MRTRNILLLYAVTFFAALYFYHPISTFYFQARGLNLLQINSLWGVIVATMALAEVPTGIVADRIGRKPSIILALGLQWVGEAWFLFATSYLEFVLIAAIAGLGFAFASGSLEAMIYDTLRAESTDVQEESRLTEAMQRVMGNRGALGQLAIVIGALVSSLLTRGLTQADLTGPSALALDRFLWMIGLTVLTVGLALVVSFFLREPALPFDVDLPTGPLSLLRDGVQLLRDNTALRGLALVAILAHPFTDYFINFYQPYFARQGVPAAWLGLGLALASTLAAFTNREAWRLARWLGERRAVLAATLLPALGYAAIALTLSPALAPVVPMWLPVLLFVTTYSATLLREPIFSGYLNRHIASYNRATVLSLINMLTGFYVALMGLLIGALADRTLAGGFWLMAVVIAVATLGLRLRRM